MEFEFLGWPEDGPTLRLDHETFSYAGKFVMSSTGKAVAREDDEILAAVAFNEDRTTDDRLWIRYVTVRRDRRGEGIGPRLIGVVVERSRRREYESVRIAVNNPFAYHALQKAGFRFTGTETGLAELVLERPTGRRPPTDPGNYGRGLERFEGRDLTASERDFVQQKRDQGPPRSSVER